jgi:hypothetical protein
MVSIIDFGVFRNVRKMVRLWLIAACFGLLVSSPFLSLAWGGVPCEDVNNNGVCDLGEKDITAELMNEGFYSTSESIVIPADAKELLTKDESGFTLMAGKNIKVSADLTARAGGILLVADGTISVGSEATLKAGQGDVDLNAGQDIVIGSHATLNAREGMVYLFSWDGNIDLMARSRLYAWGGFDIVTVSEGIVTVLSGSEISSPKGELYVNAAGNVSINGSNLQAWHTNISTEASLLTFKDNVVKVSYEEGRVSLSAAGSTIDITGTQFKKLDPANLTLDASTVIP